MLCMDHDYYMANGLYSSQFYTSEETFVEDHGGSSNLWGSTHIRITFMYCTADEVEPILEIQQ